MDIPEDMAFAGTGQMQGAQTFRCSATARALGRTQHSSLPPGWPCFAHG